MATKLYVANLPPDCSEASLNDLFSKFGTVTELDIIKNYAFIHMASNDAAQKAVAEYNNMNLNGNIISVQFSKIQNVNRGNKFTVKYDRPDRVGRGGANFSRGGFRGMGRGMMAGDGGPDFRGRGGFRGGRGGMDNLHRGKPYDRHPQLGHGQMQHTGMGSNSSNLQPVRQIGSELGVAANVTSSTRFIQPHQQQHIATQQMNRVPVVQTVRQAIPPIQPVQMQAAAVAQPVNSIPQAHVALNNQQIYQHHAAAGFQTVPAFGELQPQAQTLTPQMHGTLQHQIVQPVGHSASTVQPVLQGSVQSGGMAAQGANPVQGYTVYERYVDYRNPQTGEVTAVAASGPPVAPGGHSVTQVYQAAAQAVNKDPYANAQMMYERQAGATSRAAVYANAYYGSSPATTMVSAGNAMHHQMQVVAPGNLIQPMQLHYQ